MTAFELPESDPRWGSKERNIKAEQIWQTIQHFAECDLSDKQWLDIGCGSGGIAAHIAPHVKHITGMDPEPWPRWKNWMQANENLQFIQADVDTCTLAPESVDVIICNQVYEHVPDPQALIRLIHTLLKPGGIVYFAGPNLIFPIEPHVFWPFVHWIPRKWATQLMRVLGSKHSHELDAYSTHYWQLKRWLSPYFNITNAAPWMMHHVLPQLKRALVFKAMQYTPNFALAGLTPVMPGFVFFLKKR